MGNGRADHDVVIAFHQDGLSGGHRPVRQGCATTKVHLSQTPSVSNYRKDKVTTEELFGRVDEWLSNFEVQMNEDRERIRRLKAKVITPVEMYAYIGLLTALRVSHDSSDKRLSSKVETYPLNQSQISIFTEDLLKLTEEKKTLTAWDIYNVATEIYKRTYGHSGHDSPEQGAGRADALGRVAGILKRLPRDKNQGTTDDSRLPAHSGI